ncbi:transcription termination factor 3, mitochondrial [Caerostris extrusa]|uniref:Transcription termination factor 3, mitochondrial n=1 Tax=Caerostris extrusa TaxID=172846 RepID=A0AAV4UX45_CAEEX|nr:transcription termination factor 3, mitochondrial [Caerostris extrusa]
MFDSLVWQHTLFIYIAASNLELCMLVLNSKVARRKNMLRNLVKQYSSYRAIYLAASRLNSNEAKIQMINVPRRDSQELTEISDDKMLNSSVHSKPFAEVEKQADNTKALPSEFSEFVDDLGPPLPVAFNLAAYVNRSETLQTLVRLGVDLSEIEKNHERAKYILNLDFEKHVKGHIQFLHDNGINADNMGHLFTKNPFIFKESIEDLEVRLNYLHSKKFTSEAIVRIITANPFFLSLVTKNVDTRLGFFQKQFILTGDDVRYLVTKCPKLLTYRKIFTMKEEFGFSGNEMKKLLLMKPKIWMLGRVQLKERFNVVHNIMGISHETILKFPEVFTRREFILKQRHLYLVHLDRAQYDPEQPLYISLHDLATLSDSEFCEKKCAKTSVTAFYEFLKTL